MKPRTKETILKKLEALANEEDGGDTENNHGEADSLLCELLEKLGYKDVVEVYNRIEKWYA